MGSGLEAKTIEFTAKKPMEEPESLQEALGAMTGLKDIKKKKKKDRARRW